MNDNRPKPARPKGPGSSVQKDSVQRDMAAIMANLSGNRLRGVPAVKIAPIRSAPLRRGNTLAWPAMATALTVSALVAGMVFLRGTQPSSYDGKPTDPVMAAARPQMVASVLPEPSRIAESEPVEATAAFATPETATPDAKRAEPAPARVIHAAYAASPTRKARLTPAAYVRSSEDCEGTVRAERARCLYSDIVGADEDLRSAYGGAVRAGVSGRTLARYRNRWARLRHKSVSDPDRVVREYAEIAADLRDLRHEAGSGRREYLADAS